MSNTGDVTLPTELLQLPVSGLFADLDAGEGSVSFSDDFLDCPGAVQLALLRDWQQALARERRRAMIRLYHDLCDPLGDLPLPEKLEHFRKACARAGFECPPDMAILLQQF